MTPMWREAAETYLDTYYASSFVDVMLEKRPSRNRDYWYRVWLGMDALTRLQEERKWHHG